MKRRVMVKRNCISKKTGDIFVEKGLRGDFICEVDTDKGLYLEVLLDDGRHICFRRESIIFLDEKATVM